MQTSSPPFEMVHREGKAKPEVQEYQMEARAAEGHLLGEAEIRFTEEPPARNIRRHPGW